MGTWNPGPGPTSGNDLFTGDASNENVNGGAGADTLNGGAGNDTLRAGTNDGIYRDALYGGDGTDYLYGASSGSSYLVGGDFVNYVWTDNSIDYFYGSAGQSYFVGAAGDHFIGDLLGYETANYNTRTTFTDLRGISAGGTGTLSNGTKFQNIDVIDVDASLLESAVTIHGHAGANTLISTDFADTLYGNGGNDLLIGLSGNDTLDGGDGDDMLNGSDGMDFYNDGGNDRLVGGSGNDTMLGGKGKDQLLGGAGNDQLEGGGGADTMIGGDGDDWYFVDSAADIVTEAANEGWDYVVADLASYTLGANVEGLQVGGFGSYSNFHGVGNALDNLIRGYDGNDTLDGAIGADTLAGNAGNDVYIIDNIGDVIDGEASGGGIDAVRTALASYVLPTSTMGVNSEVENLIYTGASAFSGRGNTLDNIITGGGTSDTIDGDSGTDTFLGNYGSAVNVVAATLSSVTTDGSTVATLTNIERLNITSDAGADSLTGGALADVFNGGTGADTLTGGNGNDTYYVDNSGDVIIEAANEGIDSVVSSITWTLGANVERLTLSGATGIGGTGNALNNLLIGTVAANFLNGGAGADTLQGGLGNDVYIVDNTGDAIVEAANGGTDVVRSTVTHILAANIENLLLTGSANITGLGNALNNNLTGNAGANVLLGGGGNDVLSGAGGSDTLYGGGGADWIYGGAGADAFVLNTALGVAHIDKFQDFSVADDTIWLENAIFAKLTATGALNAGFFRVGAAAADANDHIIYNSSSGALFYDSNGNAAGGAVQIATLNAGLALTSADFLVI